MEAQAGTEAGQIQRLRTFVAAVCLRAQVAGSGNVMGGFIASAWSTNAVGNWIADPTLRSFAFSLVNAHSRSVKFKLAQPNKVAWHHPGYGVIWAGGSSNVMLKERAANAADGNVETGIAGILKLDDQYESKQGLTKPIFDMGPGFMSGMPDGTFACAEIEVFVMKPLQV